MNKALALILPVLLALLVVLGLFLVSKVKENHSLQNENRLLRETFHRHSDEIKELQAAVSRLSAPTATSVQAVALTNDAKTAKNDNPAVQEASLALMPNVSPKAAVAVPNPAEVNGAAEMPPKLPMPRPYKVRTFLGQKLIGESWIVPSNLRQDPESGRMVYEPVVQLTEKTRTAVTEYVTNVVEKEVSSGPQIVEREVYVEHRPYWFTVPQYVPVPVRHPVDPEFGRPSPVPPARPMPEGPPILKPSRPGDPGFYVPPSHR